MKRELPTNCRDVMILSGAYLDKTRRTPLNKNAKLWYLMWDLVVNVIVVHFLYSLA